METLESHLVFRVKQQLFLVNVSFVNSIISVPQLFKVPQAPEYILGIINLEGEVIPVIDTGVKLNMETIHLHKRSQIVILQKDEPETNGIQKLGFLVSDVEDVVEVNSKMIQPLPTSKYLFDERLVKGVHKLAEDFAMEIHVDNFFKEDLNFESVTV